MYDDILERVYLLEFEGFKRRFIVELLKLDKFSICLTINAPLFVYYFL